MMSPERVDRSNLFPLGGIWVIAEGSNCLSSWGEKVEEPEGSFFIDAKGVRGSYFKGSTRLYCHGILVANVTRICSDCGNPMLQLEIVPEIATQKIDDARILDRISSWENLQKEGTVVCAEIANTCAEFGINGHIEEAMGLGIWLKRMGGSRF